jgi:hypothetical protein
MESSGVMSASLAKQYVMENKIVLVDQMEKNVVSNGTFLNYS